MSRWAVLGLYRLMLRRGRELVYTDREFYHRTVRTEFERWGRERDSEKIQFQLEVCNFWNSLSLSLIKCMHAC